MKRVLRLLLLGVMGMAIGIPLAAILAAESALHIQERPSPDVQLARNVARDSGSAWETAKVTAADGVPLEAWVFTPSHANGSAVILLHGVGDTRRGVWDKANFLAKNGFTVLAPDARGHGSSGGSIVTYGIRESGDVRAWADWLFQHRPVTSLYGFGFSMGAAILLQSLPAEPRFRAVIAEAPFCTFEQIALDRMTQMAGLPLVMAWPVVKLGVLYTRLRYSVNLNDASPARATLQARIPILLIHGTLDTNISIRHSRQLAAANRDLVLWEVPGAHHIDVESVTAPALYETKVTGWFRSHP